jgi:hypothetical protein
VEAEFFHAGRWMDGQTDMTNPIAAFHHFANTPKKSITKKLNS